MANVKIHWPARNAISPKPAIMNSDYLLEHLACNIINTLLSFVCYQQVANLSSLIAKSGVPSISQGMRGEWAIRPGQD